MLSINTNLPSLIAQNSLKTSTLKLNQAVERMSTGFKINHAADNAANYSISTNMTTKINAYEVAEDNVAMGLDMLSSANGSLDLFSDKLARLRALAEQAANGTYGKQSLKAMEAEAKAIKDELVREYNTAKYNGNKIFGDSEIISGFINEVNERDTSGMTKLSSISPTQSLTSGTYSIYTAEELVQLATMTNAGRIGVDTEFVLANDIDLGEYCEENNWTPIGASWGGSTSFRGTFDGNGYVISNLKMDSDPLPGVTYFRGLFSTISETAEIRNLGLENVNISTPIVNCATLVGYSKGGTITNCYATGVINATNVGAGLIGYAAGTSITEDCYSSVDIHHDGSNAGGLIGLIQDESSVKNCFATGDIKTIPGISTKGGYVGGLIGESQGFKSIKDCYSLGDIYEIDPRSGIGGFIGKHSSTKIALVQNCYSTGNISTESQSGSMTCIGGFIGYGENIQLLDCHQTGNITIKNYIPLASQFVGSCGKTLTLQNCSAQGTSNDIRSILLSYANSGSSITIENCTYNNDLEGKFDIYNKTIPYWSQIKSVKDNSAIQFTTDTSIQCGINSSESSQIAVNTKLDAKIFKTLSNCKLNDSRYLEAVDEVISQISSKQTAFGAAQNRLESAAEEIFTQYENLISSRSTLKDADISEVSSEYIRQQILQQASATLLSTANQTPALALQLL